MGEIKLKIVQDDDPGYGSEWWTKEDWDKWNKYVTQLKRTGEYGKEVEVTINMKSSPMFDSPATSFGKAGLFIPKGNLNEP